jgi:hypothetical protein
VVADATTPDDVQHRPGDVPHRRRMRRTGQGRAALPADVPRRRAPAGGIAPGAT